MNDTLYHYIDPGFNHTQVSNYTLLLLLNPVSFSLAVMHGQKLMVWRKSALLSELNQPGEVQEVLGFAFKNVITGIRSAHFTLVPNELFDNNSVTDVARYLNVHTTDTVFAQPLNADNHIVFKINEAVTMAAARYDLPKALFGAAGWLQAIATNNPLASQLYVNLTDGICEVAYFKQGKLHLYNTFAFTHEDELAYYTIFVCQQLNLEVSTVTVILSGDVEPGDNRYHNLLGNFFNAVELNNIVVANIPETMPKHQLLALTALTQCASLADA